MDAEVILSSMIGSVPIVAIGGGLLHWLGRVQAERISRTETLGLSQKLEGFKQRLEIQQSALEMAKRQAFQDSSEVTSKQIEAVCKFWELWLEVRDGLAEALSLHGILSAEEINGLSSQERFSKAPNLIVNEAMAIGLKIERLRPLIPVQIYQHYTVILHLYLRITLRWSLRSPGQMIPWYMEAPDRVEQTVAAILKYAPSVGMTLKDPTTDSTHSAVQFGIWRFALEQTLSDLIHRFVNGSLERATQTHAALSKILEEPLVTTGKTLKG